ncbi:MAG: choice-of-anchor Q domain-containing protein [Saprospiraceae bacterium]
MSHTALVTCISVLFSIQSSAATRYVTPAGAGAMDGTSWANAFPGASLQTAITASASGDQVWVAAGTYLTTTTTTRTIYFGLKTGVAVYGSFVGNETVLSDRALTCGPTSILSAEIGSAGIADNSYHVISNTGVGNSAVLDGFVVQDGNANFDLTGADTRSLGGGMLNAGNSSGTASPTVRNCLFTNNTALFGGGMFNHGQNSGNANPIVSNCIFYANNATSGGGGMDNFGYNGNASPTVTNCIFANNTATTRAGGMYCWGGGNGNANPSILNCSFVGNSAIDGGGLVADRSNFASGNSGNSNPTVKNSIFWGNTASGTGPQFFLIGGATFTATYSDIDLTGQNAPHTISGPGTGNLNTAPLFTDDANLDGADNCWMTTDDGLHLSGGSPCINAGNNSGVPSGDLKFYQRIADGTVDMGVYEENSTPLPIVLLAFYGKSELALHQLYWTTASERNNSHFEIQRSGDALGFEIIGTVQGAGNSDAPVQYRFTDEKVLNAANYYRLKQVDVDGQWTFSEVLLLKSRNPSSSPFTYNNPVFDVLTIRTHNAFLPHDTFYLLNAYGETLYTISAMDEVFAIDLGDLPNGIYFLNSPSTPGLFKVIKAY